MVRDISNSDDVIDSRDVIARIEELAELEEAVKDAKEALAEAKAAEDAALNQAPDADHDLAATVEDKQTALDDAEVAFGEDEQAELAALRKLAEEAEGYAPDWSYGEVLIRESYFVQYCQELVEDIGDMPKGFPSYIEIDWEATARNLRMDYTEVEYDGVTYLIR